LKNQHIINSIYRQPEGKFLALGDLPEESAQI
jgi:hypothetical protein